MKFDRPVSRYRNDSAAEYSAISAVVRRTEIARWRTAAMRRTRNDKANFFPEGSARVHNAGMTLSTVHSLVHRIMQVFKTNKVSVLILPLFTAIHRQLP
jgi:hypothetical protein